MHYVAGGPGSEQNMSGNFASSGSVPQPLETKARSSVVYKNRARIKGVASFVQNPSGTASATSEYQGTVSVASWEPCLDEDKFPGACAFDQNPYTVWDGCCSGYPFQDLQYVYDRPQKMLSYSFTTAGQECPMKWLLEGSLDGQRWSQVDAQVTAGNPVACADFATTSYTVDEPSFYKFYTWRFQAGTTLPSAMPGAGGYGT